MRPLGILLLGALSLSPFATSLAATSFGPEVQVASSVAEEVSLAYTTDDVLVLWQHEGVVRVKTAQASGEGFVVTDSAARAAVSAIGERGLAVWTQPSGGVMAVRLASNGAPVGSAIRIGTNAAGSIAVAASRDAYLVAWAGNLGEVYAAVLDASAGVRIPAMPVTTQVATEIAELAAASNGDDFALVWHTWPPASAVYATTLDRNAVPSSMTPVVLSQDALFPDIASDGRHYFAVWADLHGISGRTLTQEGSAGPRLVLTVDYDTAPRLAWDGSAYSMMLVRTSHSRPGFAIPYLTGVRFRESGNSFEGLGLAAPLFPRTFDLIARPGRIDVVNSLRLQTATAELAPRVRTRAVRR